MKMQLKLKLMLEKDEKKKVTVRFHLHTSLESYLLTCNLYLDPIWIRKNTCKV